MPAINGKLETVTINGKTFEVMTSPVAIKCDVHITPKWEPITLTCCLTVSGWDKFAEKMLLVEHRGPWTYSLTGETRGQVPGEYFMAHGRVWGPCPTDSPYPHQIVKRTRRKRLRYRCAMCGDRGSSYTDKLSKWDASGQRFCSAGCMMESEEIRNWVDNDDSL